MKKSITIDQLAEMSQRHFAVIDKRLDQMVTKDLFKEGMEMIMQKIEGLHDEVKSGQLASRIIYGELEERLEHVEQDVLVLKDEIRGRKKKS